MKTLQADLEVIVVTGVNDAPTAVQAMQAGAIDYLVKPFEASTLETSVSRALAHQAHSPAAFGARAVPLQFAEIVGRDAQMRRIFELLARIADHDITVLLTGETGTGKEVLARALHQQSHRAGGPFVAVNCLAVPQALMESEFFGHERGAFTGAVARRHGVFEQAHGGVLFLDEVSGMPLEMQGKLLRVLEAGELVRVGGERPLPVDVRIIAATNADLVQLVAEGRFREDLYYRLKVIPIHLPPLRARREDIPLLVQHFLATSTRQDQGRVRRLSPAAMAALQAYAWPGNVRELEHVVQCLVATSPQEVIRPEDLPRCLSLASAAAGDTLPDAVRRLERERIREALEQAQGNQRAAARLLGIHRNTLLRKLIQLHLGVSACLALADYWDWLL